MIDGNQLVEIVRYLAGAAICIAFVWLILAAFTETEITVYRTNGTKPDALSLERQKLAKAILKSIDHLKKSSGKAQVASDLMVLKRELSRCHDVLGAYLSESNFLSIVVLVEGVLANKRSSSITESELQFMKNAINIGLKPVVSFDDYSAQFQTLKALGVPNGPIVDFDKDKIVPRGTSGHSDTTTEGPINAAWSNPNETILERLKETADKIRNQQYTPFPPRFDCVVTTKKIAQSIKENTAKPREEFFGVSILFAWDDLSDVPIYDFPNNEEAKTEAMKMLIGGIRPFLVLETETQTEEKQCPT